MRIVSNTEKDDNISYDVHSSRIFVPTERNDLADLLLGRSKRKSIHARPVSSSPTRAVSAKRNRKSVSAKTSVLEKRQEKSLASPATGDATDEAAGASVAREL